MTAVEHPLVPTRERLLDAAIEVFAERGYAGTSVQEIATRAGLTTGAIYANFDGKAHLLFEAITSHGRSYLDELLMSGGGLTGGDLMAELASHLLDRPLGHRLGLLIEAFVASRRDAELAGFVQSLLGERSDAIRVLVDRARAEGDIADAVSSDALVKFSLVLSLGSLLFNALDVELPDGDEWSSLIHRLVDALADR